MHSKAFRRLKHKTQVFVAPLGDHYATRLTHTLEVTQIARAIARFHQLYTTDDKALSARKVLELERSSGAWRIVGERLDQ